MSSASGIDAETVLRAFTDRGDSAEPLTAGEVADITGGDREILGERLRSLVERGSLESKRVGGSTQVWWRPSSAGGQPVDQILEAIPVGVVVIDASGDISYANERAEETLGLARSEVTNAIVHNDSPSPEVEITVTRADGAVRVEIADTGPRIAEMERSILVDDEERTPLYHGSSLGLWLVKLLTSRSGGTVAFEENSPTGNIVTIELQE